jgi:hypothetical protein
MSAAAQRRRWLEGEVKELMAALGACYVALDTYGEHLDTECKHKERRRGFCPCGLELARLTAHRVWCRHRYALANDAADRAVTQDAT